MTLQAITRPKTTHTEKMAAKNAGVWAECGLKLRGGVPFSFQEHLYQVEPMTLRAPEVSTRKGTQGGWTEVELINAYHGLIHGRFPQGVMYILPTDTKAGTFSKSRIQTLIDENVGLIGRHVRRTNSTMLKQVGSSFLFVVGGQLPRSVGGHEKESVALRSDPVDCIVEDEYDLMDPKAETKAIARMDHSTVQEIRRLSNPVLPNLGIDKRYKMSDQRQWLVPCDGCNHWWCMEEQFPEILRRQPDGRVIRACLKCSRELDISRGEWVPTYPSRSAYHVGYWWSQLNSARKSPGKILYQFEHPEDYEGGIADFYRYVLGLAYLDADQGLTAADVLLRCTNDPPATLSSRPTVMGVDVGKVLHVTIGYRLGLESYQVIAALVVESWPELKQVAKAFNAGVTVIDSMPELSKARDYQRAAPGEVWLCQYIESVRGMSFERKTGIVSVNRTEALDDSLFIVRTPGRLRLPRPSRMVQWFATEVANSVKVVTKDPGTGKVHARYMETGPDHFRHSLSYFLIGARRSSPILKETQVQADAAHRDFDVFD